MTDTKYDRISNKKYAPIAAPTAPLKRLVIKFIALKYMRALNTTETQLINNAINNKSQPFFFRAFNGLIANAITTTLAAIDANDTIDEIAIRPLNVDTPKIVDVIPSARPYVPSRAIPLKAKITTPINSSHQILIAIHF